MQIFKDFDGQEWTIDLNIATARAIRARMATVDSLKDVDFLDHAAMLLSLNDVFFVADLLFVVCEKQANERGIDSEAFGRSLRGDVLFDAIAAFTAEYIDFFPDPTIREKIRVVAEKNRETLTFLYDAIAKGATKELEKILDDAAKTYGEPS